MSPRGRWFLTNWTAPSTGAPPSSRQTPTASRRAPAHAPRRPRAPRASSSSGERLELRRLAAGAMRDRLREQPVGEPRVARQQRPVEIRADRAAGAAALEAALAVVAEAGDDAAERLGARIEQRPAAWFSKPASVAVARLELALEQHVADHPPLARDRLERQQPDARHAPRRGSRGSRGRAAGSRRRPRAPPRRRRRPLRAAAPPSPRGSRATSNCSRSWPPPM